MRRSWAATHDPLIARAWEHRQAANERLQALGARTVTVLDVAPVRSATRADAAAAGLTPSARAGDLTELTWSDVAGSFAVFPDGIPARHPGHEHWPKP